MRALWIDEWDGPLQVGERPDPSPERGEVLVEVESCAIGLTVLNCIRGDLGNDPADLPRIPGHEVIGRIVECGPGVDPDRAGERVGAYFYLFCGHCKQCLSGHEPLCVNLAGFFGVTRDGGYAERTTLPARNAIAIPEGIDAVSAAAIPDAMVTPVHVSRLARIQPGDRVAVIAAGGGLGIHMVQVARLYGGRVVGLENDGAKQAYLRDELEIDAADSADFGKVKLPQSWGGQVDVVVDFLGTQESLEWAQGSLGPNGRMVVLTTFRDLHFRGDPRLLVFQQGSILGSRYASRYEFTLAAELVERGDVRTIVTESVGPDGVDAVHDSLKQGKLLGRGALVWS